MRQLVRSYLPLLETVMRLRKLAQGLPPRGMVAMFHVGRCGSTVLAKAINQHSLVRWDGELFEDVKSSTLGFQPTTRWVRAIIKFAVHRRACGYFGFETKSMHFGPHCIAMSIAEYVSLLEDLHFTHFVVLTRSNFLRVLVSALVGVKTGAYHRASAPAAITRVRVDTEQPVGAWAPSLVGLLDEYQHFYSQLDLVLKGRKVLHLNYEADIERDPGIAYHKVCRFLELEPEPFEIRLARTNPYSIEQMVSNFEEVAVVLRGTRYEWMLTA
jgi:hypothetical protein